MKLDTARVNAKGEGDIYASELSMVQALVADECDVDLLSAAYFLGDLTAIQVIANKVEI